MARDHDHRSPALQALSGGCAGFAFGEGNTTGVPMETFRVLPPRGAPRLLAPVSGPALTGALECFSNIGGVRRRLMSSAIRLTNLLPNGFPLDRRLSLVGPSDLRRSPLHSFLAEIIGTGDFEMAVRLTTGRPNSKLVVAAIDPAGHPLCYAKLGMEPLVARLVRHEGDVLAEIAPMDLTFSVPEVLFAGSWHGCEVLVTDALPIEPLSGDISAANRAADELCSEADMSSSRLADSTYWSWMNERLDGTHVDGAPVVPLLCEAASHIERHWGDEVFEFGWGHGDWARTNLGTIDGELVVFDWERSRSDLPRNIDLAHCALIDATRSARHGLVEPEEIEAQTSQLLTAVERPSSSATPLMTLELYEMVLRFAEARVAGLDVDDTRFGPILKALIVRDEPANLATAGRG